MPKKQHAEFIKWMPYILDALRELGGSATPREVYDAVARLAKVPDEKRFAKLGGGGLRFPNQVAWARQNLVAEGFLTSPKRGIWMLTPLGQKTHLTYEQSREIFLKWVAIHAERRLRIHPQIHPKIRTHPRPLRQIVTRKRCFHNCRHLLLRHLNGSVPTS